MEPLIRRCGHKVGFRATDYGSAPIYCHQSVGLVTWTDVHGERRWGCGKHRDSLMRRYPVEMAEGEARAMGGNR